MRRDLAEYVSAVNTKQQRRVLSWIERHIKGESYVSIAKSEGYTYHNLYYHIRRVMKSRQRMGWASNPEAIQVIREMMEAGFSRSEVLEMTGLAGGQLAGIIHRYIRRLR